MRLLFVCLGNICRSPTAEGIMETMITQAKRSKDIQVDSAGTSSFHTGARADTRSKKHAEKRGYQLHSRARQFSQEDFDDFDMIFAMDQSNYFHILSMLPDDSYESKVYPFISFCTKHQKTYSEVPDPYNQGEEGFEIVLDIIEEGCQNILEQILKTEKEQGVLEHPHADHRHKRGQ